jgi:hypothetical protein
MTAPSSPGRGFFPQLISGPFRDGLHAAFLFAIVACLIAAAASFLRGGAYHYEDEPRQQREEHHAGSVVRPVGVSAD